MRKNLLIASVIAIIGFSEFMTGCASKNPIDRNLDQIETVIEKWEDKGEIHAADIIQLQQDMMNVGGGNMSQLMDEKNWTTEQKERYRELQERAARLMQKNTND